MIRSMPHNIQTHFGFGCNSGCGREWPGLATDPAGLQQINYSPMQKRIEGQGDHTAPSTEIRTAVRAIESKTASETDSIGFQNQKHESDFARVPTSQRNAGRMTQSEKPTFTKITAKRAEFIRGCEQLQKVTESRMRWGFHKLHAEGAASRQESKASFGPSVMSKQLGSDLSWQQLSKDLVRRNSTAEELLSSLPIKYKKKMRAMIEEYEKERVELIKQIKVLSRTGLTESSLEKERLSQLLESANKEMEYWRVRCVGIQENIAKIIKGQPLRVDFPEQLLLRLEKRVTEAQSKLLSSQLQNQVLNHMLQTQAERHNNPPQQQTKKKAQPPPSPQKRTQSESQQLSLSKVDKAELKASSSSKYFMAPVQRLHRADSNCQYPSRKIPQALLTPPKPAPRLRRALSRGSNYNPSSVASSEPQSEEDFGKEKVIQRRRMRKLLRGLLVADTESKKSAFKKLATQIGLRSDELDSYSTLF